MTHPSNAKYAAKHPPGEVPNPRVAESITTHLISGKLSCQAASMVAKELGVPLGEVGKTADLMEIPVFKCLLGLFGQEGSAGEKKSIKAVESVPDEMKQAILTKTKKHTVDCLTTWQIADETGCPLTKIASYCEKLGIKITRCQLGAFK